MTNNMTVDQIVMKVKEICLKNNVKHLYLFGSYAKGTAHKKSDIDFVLKGMDDKDIDKINEEISTIDTLKRIDLFNYNKIENVALKEAMDIYGKIIY